MEKDVENQAAGHLNARLEEALATAFSNAGWHVSTPEQRSDMLRPDLMVETEQMRYVVELKVARDARRQELQGLLADAVLQARAAANQLNGKPLAIIGAPALSDRLVEDLKDYMETYAPDQAFGFIDARGRLELVGPLLDELRAGELLDAEVPSKIQKPPELFSDLNQWLLKLLLSSKIPADLLGAPRRKDIRNAADLAKTGRVSVPTASRFVSLFKSAGFLESRPRRLELVRVQELLKRWRIIRLESHRVLPTRFILPSSDPAHQLRHAIGCLTEGRYDWDTQVRWLTSPKACLAQFSACAELGFGFVTGVPAAAYLDEIRPETLTRLGLRAAEEGEEVQVLLQVPRWPEAIFRAVTLSPGVPTADVLQCWLDVAHHPARGEEQADLIWNRVLSEL